MGSHRKVSVLGQDFPEPRIKPRADRKRDLKRLNVKHDFQGSARGVEDHAAAPTTRQVCLQRCAKLF